jgi:hypothetical protein
LLNRGTTDDSCINYLFALKQATRGAENSNPTKPYFGEAFLPAGGIVHDYTLTPNHFRVNATPAREGVLVLNQNYHVGWKVGEQPALNNRGLVAAPVTPETRSLEFSYRPWSYTMGKFISLASLTAMGAYFMKNRFVLH